MQHHPAKGSGKSIRRAATGYFPLVACLAIAISGAAVCGRGAAQTAGWQPETRLTDDEATSSTAPNNAKYVAVDLDGNVHIVWIDDRDRNFEIYHKMRIAGIWSADERLSFAQGSSARPNLAVTASGFLHLAWNDERDGNMEIYHRYWTEGAWSNETRITNTPGDSFASALVAVGDTLHMVYMETVDTSTQIVYRTFRSFAWSAPLALTNAPTGQRMVPTIDRGADGSIHVAWWDTRADASGMKGKIYYRRKSGGVWLDEELVTDPEKNAMRPSIAVDDSGFVHIVWIDGRDIHEQIYHRRRGPAGWEGETAITNESVIHYHPSIDAAGGEAFLAYWDARVSESNTEVYFRRRTASGWSGPTRVSDGPAGSELCCLVAEPNKNLHVAWVDMRDGNREIYYREYIDPANGVGGGDDIPAPRLLLSLAAHPNPFRGSTNISLSVAGECRAWIAVYRIDGRRVRSLARKSLASGIHAFEWDGRNDAGERLPPGIYFAIARVDKTRLVAKMVLLR